MPPRILRRGRRRCGASWRRSGGWPPCWPRCATRSRAPPPCCRCAPPSPALAPGVSSGAAPSPTQWPSFWRQSSAAVNVAIRDLKLGFHSGMQGSGSSAPGGPGGCFTQRRSRCVVRCRAQHDRHELAQCQTDWRTLPANRRQPQHAAAIDSIRKPCTQQPRIT